MQSKILVLAVLFSFGLMAQLHAQTPGLIYDPASSPGNTVLDPDGDGFVSVNINAPSKGFVYSDQTESEIPYQKMIFPGAEPVADLTKGPSGGFSDFVDSGVEDPAQYYLDASNNLMFRLRIGSSAPNSKGYSILIDTDQKFGFTGPNADPTATTSNPGFEVEINLQTNFGVYVYNVDGGCPGAAAVSHTGHTNYQKSFTLSTITGTRNSFYDFYVPFSDLEGLGLGITSSTPLRMIIITQMNPSPALCNNATSDLGGVDDSACGSLFGCLLDIIDNYTPTSADDIQNGVTPKDRSDCPTLTGPVTVSSTSINGTTTELAGTSIQVYKNGASLGAPVITSVDNASWSLSGVSGLVAGDVITATATGPGEGASIANCSSKTVITSCTPPGTPTLTAIGNGDKVLTGTKVTGTHDVYIYKADGTLLTGGITSNPFSASGTTFTYTHGTGGTKVPDGAYYVVISLSGCNSLPSAVQNNNCTASTTPTINTATIYESTTTISITGASGASLRLWINGVASNFTATGTGSAQNLTVSGLSASQSLTVVAVNTATSCPATSAAKVVQADPVTPNKPTISGSYCVTGTQTLTITGSSVDADGTSIQLFKNSVSHGSAVTVSSGAWSASGSFAAGDVITARATIASLTSGDSDPVTVLAVNTNAVAITTDPIVEGSTSISGTGVDGDVIKLYVDDAEISGKTATVGTGTPGQWTITGIETYSLYAGAQVTVTATSGSSCESSPSAAVEVVCSTPATPSFSDTNLSYCYGSQGELTLSTSESLVIYEMVDNTGASIGQQSIGTGSSMTLYTNALTSNLLEVYVKAFKLLNASCYVISSNSVDFDNQLPSPTIDLTSTNVDVVSGSTTASFTYTNPQNSPSDYSIAFPIAAENQGFADVSSTTLPSSPIVVTVPAAAASGTYTAQLTITGATACESLYNISITIYDAGAAASIATHPASDTKCSGESVSFSVSASNVQSYQWQLYNGSTYDNLSDGGIYSGVTSSNLNISDNTGLNANVYRVEVVGYDAIPLYSNDATLTVVAIDAGVIGSNQAICSGDTPSLLTSTSDATGTAVTYQWRVSNDGFSFTNISGATSSTYAPGSLTSTKYYLRKATSTANGYSCEDESNLVTITVTGSPDLSGLSTSASDECIGNNSTVTVSATNLPNGTYTVNYTLTGTNAQSATNTTMVVSSGNSGTFTTSSLPSAGTTNLTINSLTLSGCSTTASSGNTDAITVSPASVGGSISGGATVCSGTNSTTLTLSGHTGSITKWQSSTDNFASDINDIVNTTTSQTATNLTATTSYRAVVTSGSCSSANSSTATVTVVAQPTEPTVNSQVTNNTEPIISGNADSGNSITVVVGGATYVTVANASGNWSIDTASPNSGSFSPNTNGVNEVVVGASNGSCSRSDATTNELTIDTTAPSTVPTVVSQTTNDTTPTITGTATVGAGETLTVTVDGVTYTAGDGNLVDNGDGTWSLTIPAGDALAENTYSVTATVTDAAGNSTSDSTTGELIVNTSILAPTGESSQSFCTADNPTIANLVVTGSNIKWYSNPTGGSPLSEATSLVSGTKYYASQTEDGAESSERLEVTVTVNTTPTIALDSSNDPGTCSGTDGSLLLSFTNVPDGIYTLTYRDGSASDQTFDNVSVVSNAATIGNIEAGVYNDIAISVNGCTSLEDVDVTMSAPSPETISKGTTSDPSNCDVLNGSIQLIGLSANSSYTVNYTVNSVDISTTISSNASGTLLIRELGAGEYRNIFVVSQSNECQSNELSGSIVLEEPAVSTISVLSSTNPSACSTSDGVIILDGLLNSARYTVSYLYNGRIISGSMLAVSGRIEIENLSVGYYSNFKVKISGCESNTISESVVLTDPASPEINLNSVNSTSSCNASDGVIKIGGLIPGSKYTYEYTYVGRILRSTQSITASGAGIVEISGLSAGIYQFISLTNESSGCQSNTIESAEIEDTGAPEIAFGTTSDPTICDGADGFIRLTGLSANREYGVSFLADDLNVSTTITSNGSGVIEITGLRSGTYKDFTVNRVGCVSNQLSAVIDLDEPVTPVISVTDFANPSICGEADGWISLGGTIPDGSYNVQYDFNGSIISSVIVSSSGVLLINNLSAGSYQNFSIELSGCSSNIVRSPISLNDPGSPEISFNSQLNPTSCASFDGFIKLSGLTPSVSYNYAYFKNGVEVTSDSPLLADAAGVIEISNLTSGSYSNLSVSESESNCRSNTIETIALNPPDISIWAYVHPTTCNGTDGKIEIEGLTPGVSYTLSYRINSGAEINDNIVADSWGNYALEDLSAGDYSDITVEIDGCISNALSVDLNSPDNAVIALENVTVPLSCEADNGSIKLTGLEVSTDYELHYTSNSQKDTLYVRSDGSGYILISNLAPGEYTSIYVISKECQSNTLSSVIVGQAPEMVIVSVNAVNPTTCGGMDGNLALTFQDIPDGSYSITYSDENLNEKVFSGVSILSGSANISGLTAGSYNDLRVIVGSCKSTGDIDASLSDLQFCDTDGDGVSDAEEDIDGDGDPDNDDTDGDGTPDYLDTDDDGDGILTEDEDTDGDGDPTNDDCDTDGTPNYLDSDPCDTDGDGLDDSKEDTDGDGNPYNDDCDGDGTPNFQDPDVCDDGTDTDGDGVTDVEEDLDGDGDPDNDDTDGDGTPDYLDTDDDGDGILTEDEDIDGDGDPTNDDCDADGTPNYLDSDPCDTDGDGLDDSEEDTDGDGNPYNDDCDGDGTPNFQDPDVCDDGTDTDGDGVTDAEEDIDGDGDPDNDDSDGDGTPDYLDTDDDGDGILTEDEDTDGDGDPTNDDCDADGTPNYLDSDPCDTDGDGLNDTEEDTDGDGNPYNDDCDGDGTPNFQDGDSCDTDGDGILDEDEDTDGDGDPTNDDCDADGTPNYLDSDPCDTDGDGLNDNEEDTNGDGNPYNDDCDGDGTPNFQDDDSCDTDGDGVLDSDEDVNGDGDPTNDDSDGDGTPDYLDTDDDGDGIDTKDEDTNDDGDPRNDDCDDDGAPNYLDTDQCAKVEPRKGFTPDGDGINDFFYIKDIENYPNNTVQIFNRWGNKVFEIRGYDNQNNVWASEVNAGLRIGTGNNVPSGTYYYLIQLGDGSDAISGFVVVNR
ncbi:gliding motility-associated C-terminal domain-containing protein [Marinoscillum sp.]|uniref:T9SS type B sorting domain-containing protein n=1 Tax=Marinoscillum sp. TaxID=2024838 RepID=UPI0032F78217